MSISRGALLKSHSVDEQSNQFEYIVERFTKFYKAMLRTFKKGSYLMYTLFMFVPVCAIYVVEKRVAHT